MSRLVRRSLSTLAARPLDPQEVRLRPQPIWSQALVWTIIGTALAGLGYAVVAQIDEVVVAPGILQPKGAQRPIKASIAGKVAEILVIEGQQVQQGQPLLRLDADRSDKRSSTVALKTALERQRFLGQTKAFEARERSLRARSQALQQALLTERQILAQIEPLVRQGGMQQLQLLQQRNRVQQLRSELAQSEANLQEVQAELLRLRQESLSNLADLDRQRVEVQEEQQEEVLLAPVSGVVFDLVPASPGYAATVGEVLLNVVPQGQLEAKVYFTNREVGFVKPGQSALIRVDTFPFTQFGSIPGEVKAVSAYSLPPDPQNPQPRFPAYVRLNRTYLERDGRRYAVGSGQSVQVNVVLRQKRVITLLTDVFDRAADSMRRIRSPGSP